MTAAHGRTRNVTVGRELFPAPGLGRLRERSPVLGRTATAAAILVNTVVSARVVFGITPPWWVSLVALLAVFVPALRLVSWKIGWQTTSRAEQLIYSFATVLLGLLVGGLVINTVLPWVGVARPLDPVPVLMLFDVGLAWLLLWRWDRVPPPARVITTWVPYSPREVGLVGGAALAVVLACAGATRLNNGADGAVALSAILVNAGVWFVMLRDRYRLRPGPVHLAVFFCGLALLLGTALRSWYIAGHDVQREYRLFHTALANGHWDIATYRDAYNACLSVTLLPTMLCNLTGLDPVYVVKVVPSLVFAVCPVAVYLIAQRFVTRGPALLGVLVFVAFPTFYSDMPFLTRQEYAFTFVGAAFLAATNLRFSVGRRRLVFGAFALGVLFSHYSTNYVLVAILMLGLVIHSGLKIIERQLPQRLLWLRRHRPGGGAGRQRDVKFVLGIINLAALVLTTFLWAQQLTGTNAHLIDTLSSAVSGIVHPGGTDARSADTRYSLFGGSTLTPDERLAAYRDEVVAQTAHERELGTFRPLAGVVSAPIPALPPESRPPTALGSLLGRLGIDVATTNTLLRAVLARLLQVFVVVGMLAVLFGYRRRWINASPELTILAGASFGVVLIQVVLPQLSAEYGVLRAFQQSLILMAPFLAIGMIASLTFLRRAAAPAAAALGLVMLLSLTGALPQVTGGFPAQLNLNNAGQYFDIYYTREPEVTAAEWALARVHAEGLSDENNIQTDRFSYARLQPFPRVDTGSDIFPVMLRSTAYTLVTSATLERDRASVPYHGDVITYRYPMSVLSTQNLVYSNGYASVFR